MSNPTTIRGWLDLVENHLATIAQNTTTIAGALVANQPDDAEFISGQRTIADLLYRALTVSDSEFGDGNRFLLTPLIARNLGYPFDNGFVNVATPLLSRLTLLETIAAALGAFPLPGNSVTVAQNLASLRFQMETLLGNMQTGEYPSPLRNAIENILEALGTINGGVQSSSTNSAAANVLLQQLINCSPCGSLPQEPSICDGTNGFLTVSAWDTWEDTENNVVSYYGRITGNVTIGQYTFFAQTINQPGVPFPVEGMVAVKSGTAPAAVTYCVEWAGNSQQNSILFLTGLLDTPLFNGGVTLNSPAPSSASDTDQVFAPSLSARSTYAIVVPGGAIGSSVPPLTSRVFITPLVAS